MTNTTEFFIINDSNEEVNVYLTLGLAPGNFSEISQVKFIKHITNPNQGYFSLKPQKFVSFNSPKNLVFSGNVSFNAPPLNCPTNEFPMGVNLGEFTLNNAHEDPKNFETIDISNVAGANSFMKFSMIDGGDWNAGDEHPNVKCFKNAELGKNLGNVGVYPFACDVCTASVAPPHCNQQPLGAPSPIIPQKESICNVQRPASTSGGTVALTYLGSI